MPYLLVALMAALLVVFGVSAWSKVRSPAAQRVFAASLRPLPLLPSSVVVPVAAAVTAAEVTITLGLAWAIAAAMAGAPGTRPAEVAVLGGAGLLLAVLTTGVAVAIRRPTGARCACFGATERPISRRHLVRNALLLLIVAAGLIVVAAATDRPGEPAGVVLGLACGAVAALILIRLDDLVDLFAPPRQVGRG